MHFDDVTHFTAFGLGLAAVPTSPFSFCFFPIFADILTACISVHRCVDNFQPSSALHTVRYGQVQIASCSLSFLGKRREERRSLNNDTAMILRSTDEAQTSSFTAVGGTACF